MRQIFFIISHSPFISLRIIAIKHDIYEFKDSSPLEIYVYITNLKSNTRAILPDKIQG